MRAATTPPLGQPLDRDGLRHTTIVARTTLAGIGANADHGCLKPTLVACRRTLAGYASSQSY
jgi:hypothetical protein